MPTKPDLAIRELDPTIRELDRRFNDGIDVALFWNESTNEVSVVVQDGKAGEYFQLEVDPEDALTAFHHPYSYTSRRPTDPMLAA